MKEPQHSFIPALGANWATRFYDPLVRLTTREFTFKRALIAQANLSDNQSVLDLACGTGTLSIGIKRRFPDINIFAVDADQNILKIAENKSAARGVSINFKQAFSDSIPFPRNRFDRVFSTLSFHHLTVETKIKTLVETLRVLKPNGELHLADYGKPANRSQKALSNVVRIVDGDETTRDNFTGRLKELFYESGFCSVKETNQFKTALGTIRLFRAVKT